MKKVISIILFLCLIIGIGATISNAAVVTIENDTVWVDTDGNEILAQGGGIIQVGDTFHWFGPQFGPTGQVNFVAINHYSSKDLKNWTKHAPAFTPESDGIPMQSGQWVGRPWVFYNEPTKKFVMVIEWGSARKQGVRNRIAYLTASSIDGPWKYERVDERVPDINGRLYSMGDLGGFQDDDGNAYLLYTFDKPQTNRSQAIAKLNPDNYLQIEKVVAEFDDEVREAASVFKRNGIYYYTSSRCNGWYSSETKYRTAASMNGPWSEDKLMFTSPPSDDSFNTQHDFILPIYTSSGETVYVYFGDRWSNMTGEGEGKYAWFPITFTEKGEPILNGLKEWQIDVGVSLQHTLKELIELAQSKIKGNYTPGSWEDLAAALDAAEKVAENESATNEIIQKAMEDLSGSIDSLLHYGDVDGDKSVTTSDALWVLQSVTGSREFDDVQTEVGDVDFDGKISSMDTIKILKFVTERITVFSDASE